MSETPGEMIRNVVEAALLAAGEPLALERLVALFAEDEAVGREEIRTALGELEALYADRGIELKEVASGWRLQVRESLAPWVSRLWETRPPKYSRALLETLALIAYQQPVTRSDIEQVRGVSVSSGIIKTLLDRDWIRILGHRDVPGRPALYGTTRMFLDYFDLRSLDQLPPLAEIRSLDEISGDLDLDGAQGQPAEPPDADGEGDADAGGASGTEGPSAEGEHSTQGSPSSAEDEAVSHADEPGRLGEAPAAVEPTDEIPSPPSAPDMPDTPDGTEAPDASEDTQAPPTEDETPSGPDTRSAADEGRR